MIVATQANLNIKKIEGMDNGYKGKIDHIQLNIVVAKFLGKV